MTSDRPEPARHDRLRDLLAIGSVRLWMLGQVASTFGDNAMWIATGIWVKELTGSTAAAGLVVLAIASPQVLASPFAGLVTDRVNRKRLMWAANLCGAASVLPLLLVHNRGMVWMIYLSMVGYGIVSAALNTTQSALLTEVVPAQLIGTANAVLRGARESLRIAAPVVGATILRVAGPATMILFDSATFLIAALSTFRLSPRPGTRVAEGASRARNLLAGATFAWRDGPLRRLFIVGALAFGAYGVSETVIYAMSGLLGRPPTFVGILSSTTGIGGLIGGITGVPLVRRRGSAAAVNAGLVLLVLSCPLQATGVLPLVLAGEVLFGLSLPWASIGMYTLIQLRSPGHLQGRVYGAFEVFAGIPQIAAIAGGAGLIVILNVRYLLAAMAVMATLGIITTAGKRGFRGAPGVNKMSEHAGSAIAGGAAPNEERNDALF